MAIENAPKATGKESAKEFRKETAEEEKRVEAQKGSDLAKGADRVEERSESSDGKGPGEKQQS